VWPGTDSPARPVLHAPPGARDCFRRVVGAWGNEDLIEGAFDLREYDPAQAVEVGPFTLRFCAVPHYVPTYAIEITSAAAGSGRFVFGADSSPNDAIVEFARDADLLVMEATLPRPERTGVRGHLTPGEAAEHARRAGVRRLVLTHVSDELGERWVRDEGERAFGGPVEVAREGAVYAVTPARVAA
jgi:ribonuclease BN (tRNA processing enzyme)